MFIHNYQNSCVHLYNIPSVYFYHVNQLCTVLNACKINYRLSFILIFYYVCKLWVQVQSLGQSFSSHCECWIKHPRRSTKGTCLQAVILLLYSKFQQQKFRDHFELQQHNYIIKYIYHFLAVLRTVSSIFLCNKISPLFKLSTKIFQSFSIDVIPVFLQRKCSVVHCDFSHHQIYLLFLKLFCSA